MSMGITVGILNRGLALVFSFLLLVCLPLGVQGFAGDSYLSQPLNAQDHVISVRLRDVESVPTKLVPIDAFDRTGESRIYTLTQPECAPTRNDGGVKTEYIRDGIPAVLVEVAPYAKALIAQAKQTFSTGSELTGGRATPTQGDSRTYRVRPGDTLLNIVRDHIIDKRFSLQQKMIATWRANPEAFSGDNINNLKTDKVLRLPDSTYIALISREAARAEVARQYANWLELRATSPEATPAAVEMTIEAPPQAKQPIGLNAAKEGREEIPAPYETDLQQDIVAAPDYADVKELQQKLERMRALAESHQQEREQLIAENRELKEIIVQQEGLIERQRDKLAYLEQSSPEKVGASDPKLPAEASLSAHPTESVKPTDSNERQFQQTIEENAIHGDTGFLTSDLFAIAFISSGLFFFIAGSIGLLRLPDVYSRLHALTKADNVGLGLLVAGVVLLASSWLIAVKLVLVWVLVLASSAASAHLIAQRARRRESYTLRP